MFAYNIGTSPRFIGNVSGELCIFGINDTPITCSPLGTYIINNDVDTVGPMSFIEMPNLINNERIILIVGIRANTNAIKRIWIIKGDTIMGPYLSGTTTVGRYDNPSAALYNNILTL